MLAVEGAFNPTCMNPSARKLNAAQVIGDVVKYKASGGFLKSAFFGPTGQSVEVNTVNKAAEGCVV